MGKTDRNIRIIIGLAIAGVSILSGSWWGLAAVFPLGTAFLNYCPIYGVLNWSTERNNGRPAHAENRLIRKGPYR